jgi:hypothetical protein
MHSVKEDPMADSRVPVPDPALMRRATYRIIVPFIIVMVLLTFFTVGGISLVINGELPGLPFAIGGAIAQLAVLVLVGTVLRVRLTLNGDTISTSAVTAAGRTVRLVRRALRAAVAALLLYALVRAAIGDRWTLLTAAIISVALWTIAVGTRRLVSGLSTLRQSEP